jgi:hypothetical protein
VPSAIKKIVNAAKRNPHGINFHTGLTYEICLMCHIGGFLVSFTPAVNSQFPKFWLHTNLPSDHLHRVVGSVLIFLEDPLHDCLHSQNQTASGRLCHQSSFCHIHREYSRCKQSAVDLCSQRILQGYLNTAMVLSGSGYMEPIFLYSRK